MVELKDGIRVEHWVVTMAAKKAEMVEMLGIELD